MDTFPLIFSSSNALHIKNPESIKTFFEQGFSTGVELNDKGKKGVLTLRLISNKSLTQPGIHLFGNSTLDAKVNKKDGLEIPNRKICFPLPKKVPLLRIDPPEHNGQPQICIDLSGNDKEVLEIYQQWTLQFEPLLVKAIDIFREEFKDTPYADYEIKLTNLAGKKTLPLRLKRLQKNVTGYAREQHYSQSFIDSLNTTKQKTGGYVKLVQIYAYINDESEIVYVGPTFELNPEMVNLAKIEEKTKKRALKQEEDESSSGNEKDDEPPAKRHEEE